MRRKFFTEFLMYFNFEFKFSDENILLTRDIKAIEKIFKQFNTNELFKKQFSVKALNEFKSLSIYWLYLSYPKKSMSLLLRFIRKHIMNMGITPEEKLKVFMHLTLGKEYKRRF